MKLKPVAAGLALGVLLGVGLFLMTVIAMYTGFAETQLNLLVGVYPYYEVSWTGAIAGFVDGLIDGFFGGAILVLLYNAFAGCCCKECK